MLDWEAWPVLGHILGISLTLVGVLISALVGLEILPPDGGEVLKEATVGLMLMKRV